MGAKKIGKAHTKPRSPGFVISKLFLDDIIFQS
jgi:hypothetical protein